MEHNSQVKSIFLLFIYSILLCTIYGCTPPSTTKQSINAVFKVPVTNQSLHQLTKITNKLSIKASGLFNQGRYFVHGQPLNVQKDTVFKLSLELPIDNADFINTENLKGQLWTSQPLDIHGMLLPKQIILENGKISGEIDFLRVFSTFLLNTLQTQSAASADRDMRAIIKSLQIDDAVLELRPNSLFAKTNGSLCIGEHSQITFSNLIMDHDFNYTGLCKVDLNFVSNNNWVGKRVDCHFGQGSAHLLLKAQRQNGVLTLTLADEAKQQVFLEQALLKFGKYKASSALCQKCPIIVRELFLQKNEIASDTNWHFLGDLKLIKTNLIINSIGHQTTAYFPGSIPAKLKIDVDQTAVETKFATLAPALAQKAVIEINRPTSKLSLILEQAKIGTLAFDKTGSLNLSFAKGKAYLRELRWRNGNKYLSLKSRGISQLELPAGMYLLLDKINGPQMSLPLTLKMGSASIDTSAGRLSFKDIDGKLIIDIHDEITLQGDISFVIEESSFLGSHQIAVKTKGLKFSPKKANAVVHLQQCSLVISSKDLQDIIQSQFPKNKCLNMDKVIFEKRHWRYKNAEIKKITLSDLTLQKLDIGSANSAKLAVSADVVVEGSVDKSSVLSAVKGSKKYQSKPWQIKAHCLGFGDFRFKFLSNGDLAKSQIPYTLNVTLPIPDDVQLDWSQVESGIYKGLEHGIILSILKKMQAIPFTHEGIQPLFNKIPNQLQSIKINNINTKGLTDGVQIDFEADATF